MHRVSSARRTSSSSSSSLVQKKALQYWRRWFGSTETIGPWHDVNEFAHLLISDPFNSASVFLDFFRSTTSDCEPEPPKPFEFSPHSIGANGATPSVSQQLPHTSPVNQMQPPDETEAGKEEGNDGTDGAGGDANEGTAAQANGAAAAHGEKKHDTDEAGVPSASSPPSGRIRNPPVLKQEASARYRLGPKGRSPMKSVADPGKHVVCLDRELRVRSGCARHSLQSRPQYAHTLPLCAGLCCSQGNYRRWPAPVRWRGAFIHTL
jgi:hypothetical protein